MQSANLFPSITIRWAGIIAIVAALLGVIADLALQYTPNAAHMVRGQSLYFLDIPPSRLFLGHYLGVAAILVEIVGFWQVYRALQPAGERFALPFFLISSFGAAMGAAFHGTAIFIGLTLQAQSGAAEATHQALAGLLASFEMARLGLAIPALLGIVIGSLWYAFVVGFKPSHYPRWMAICNPFVFALLFVILALGIPLFALVLTPTALNLSHLVFFVFSTATLWKRAGAD